MIRQQVSDLIKLGPLPGSDADVERIEIYEKGLNSISAPVTNEEACSLVKIFGPDECYGLAWTLIHLIESAPDWPIIDCLEGENEWVNLLRIRVRNAENIKGA